MLNTFCLASRLVLCDEEGEYSLRPAVIFGEGSTIREVRWLTSSTYHEHVASLASRCDFKNLEHLLVTPSFVNAHTHLALGVFRGVSRIQQAHQQNIVEEFFFPYEARLTPEDVRAFSRMGAYESILNGVGLVWDHYYFPLEVARGCQDVGLSAVVAPTVQDLHGPWKSRWEQFLEETLTLNHQEVFKKSGIFAAFGPHAVDTVSPRLWAHVLAAAEQLQLPLHAHFGQSWEEWRTIHKKYGKTPTEHLESLGILSSSAPFLGVHGVCLNAEDFLRLQKSKNTSLVFCPFSQSIFFFPAQFQEWVRHQLSWFIGTDCTPSNDSMNVQKELKLVYAMAALEKTFSGPIENQEHILPEPRISLKTLFQSVTSGPGSFHPQFRAGVLAAGCLANIAVWDSNHPSFWPTDDIIRTLVLGDTTGALYNLCVAGRWLGEDGNFANSILNSSDYQQARQEAQERFQRWSQFAEGQ